LSNLDTLIAKTEVNYAGFPDKVNAQNIDEYRLLKKDLKTKAAQLTEAKPCFFVLSEFVKFFYDSHFSLTYTNEKDFDVEIIAITKDAFREQLHAKTTHELEGIWTDQDSSLVIGIKKYLNNTFKAIVLETKDSKIPLGLVYMTITPGKRGLGVKYYNSFSSTDYPLKLKGNLLQGWSDKLFGRVFPNQLTDLEKRELSTWRNYNRGLDFYRLSPKTALLKIPTFGNNDDKIAQFVARNDSIIRSSENLIVDLTGNSGGSTGWVSLLGYFMTKPIVQQNGFLRVSPENVKAKLKDIEPYVIYPIPLEYEKYFPETTVNLYKKAYQELPTTKQQFYSIPSVAFPLDSITGNPKKIALVVDNLCGSSTEYFFYLTKQSAKTTTYGVNTFGMMDYEGASSNRLPYANFRVSIPIVKSSWTDSNPIDRTGFTPDVILDKTKPESWIKDMQKRLER
jgi:hypothetical protein